MAYTSDPASFPEPVDLSHHLSRSTKAREASQIKRFYKYFSIPGIAQLAGGTHAQPHSMLPNSSKERTMFIRAYHPVRPTQRQVLPL
jgi:hypothetical protein